MSSALLPLMAGDFIAGLPSAFWPWQEAHFALYVFSPAAASCARATDANRPSDASKANPDKTFFITSSLVVHCTRRARGVGVSCRKSTHATYFLNERM